MIRFYQSLSVFFSAFFFVSCESEEMKQLSVRRETTSRNIETSTDRISRASKKLEKLRPELLDATKDAEPSLKLIESSEARLAEVRESISKIERNESDLKWKAALLDAYQNAFIEKTLPNGELLGDIILKDGKTFTEAAFSGVSDGNVRFKHSGGIFQSPFSNFPETVRSRLSARPNAFVSDSFLAVLDKKPASLMSQGEFIAVQDRAATRAENEANEREAARQREIDERDAERQRITEEYSQREASRRQQIAEIDSRLSMLVQQFQQVQLRHQAALSEARNRKIPMSAKDIQALNDSFTVLEGPLEQQISQLKAERSAILRQ